MNIVSENPRITEHQSFADIEGEPQTVKLSETTLSALTEAIVNLEPSTIFNTSNLNPDKAQSMVESLIELYQKSRETNNFRPCLVAIMGLIGQNNGQL